MAAQWDDLKARVLTALAMAVVGIGALWIGGAWFTLLVAIVSGLMIWELSRMIAPQQIATALQLGLLGAAAVLLARALPGFYAFPILAAPALVGVSMLTRHRTVFGVYAFAILLAGYGLALFRGDFGLVWLLWLVLVVIATDVFGYFAGRALGGPKFWPAISPKKTWSGTAAGWVSAAVVGLIFMPVLGAGFGLVLISMLVSFASQMGDIAESAIKRKMGVKDSSNLLPGHGGLFDRFDGLLGAALFMLLVIQLVPVPGVSF